MVLPLMTQRRSVFFLSDRTGITAEQLGHTLLTQFDADQLKMMTLPFVNTEDKARSTLDYINQAAQDSEMRPIIFSTTVSEKIRAILRQANGLFIDLFDAFLVPLEAELKASALHIEGRAHGVADYKAYGTRMDAMNFALHHDDGLKTAGLDKADVILLAPSRCGKTPTCIYLAMQYGLHAANYPLTDEDLERNHLPEFLRAQQGKLYGIISEPEELTNIREQRRPGSRYASMAQVRYELNRAERLYQQYGIPYLNSAQRSIEEMSTLIMQEKGLRRQPL